MDGHILAPLDMAFAICFWLSKFLDWNHFIRSLAFLPTVAAASIAYFFLPVAVVISFGAAVAGRAAGGYHPG
jgi:hypothetical protein